jgi:uncharacterized protein (TIRG00374 family)
MTSTRADEDHAGSRRRLLRRLAAAVTLGLVGAEVVVLRHYLARAVAVIAAARPGWMLLAVAGSLISMGCFARMQRRMLRAAGTAVPIGRVVGLVYAANAVNVTLPGGSALSAGYLIKKFTAWGANAPAAGFTVLASGVLSSATFAGLVSACGLLAGHSGTGCVAVVVGLVAMVMVVLLRRVRRLGSRSELVLRWLARVNRLTRREPDRGADAVSRFVADIADIRPSRRDWAAGAGFAALNWLADLGCLAACCQAVGLRGGSVVLILSAYLAGMAASSIAFLPGGIGVIDVAMVLALTGAHVSAPTATAAVLLYRLISCIFIVVLGWGFLSLARMWERQSAVDRSVTPGRRILVGNTR